MRFQTPLFQDMVKHDPKLRLLGVALERAFRDMNANVVTVEQAIPAATGATGGGTGGGGGMGTTTLGVFTAGETGIQFGHLVHVSGNGLAYKAVSTTQSRGCTGWASNVSGSLITVGGFGSGAFVKTLDATMTASENRMFLSRTSGFATSVDPRTLTPVAFEWRQEVGFQCGSRASDLTAPWIFRAGEWDLA